MLPNVYPKMHAIPEQCMDGQDLCGYKHTFKVGTESIDRRILGVMFQMQMLTMTFTKATGFNLV